MNIPILPLKCAASFLIIVVACICLSDRDPRKTPAVVALAGILSFFGCISCIIWAVFAL